MCILDYNIKLNRYDTGRDFIAVQLAVKVLNSSAALQNCINELNCLFIRTLIRIKLLEFIDWLEMN